jgi:hypothetical protein
MRRIWLRSPAAVVADYTLDEITDQVRKASRYFGRALAEQDRGFFAAQVDGVVLVVARNTSAEMLAEAIEQRAALGPGAVVNRDKPTPTPTPTPEPEPTPEPRGRELQPRDLVTLIPMYHRPPPEHASKRGNVHLHTLNDAKLGRRERFSGECLCSKKHGSGEESVSDETRNFTMCEECVRVARENGVEWSL